MPRKTQTPGEAWRLLKEYERLNSDLPRETSRQLAVFVLAPKVGTSVLEDVFQRPLGKTPVRHRCWLWYNAMRLAGLEAEWREFVRQYNTHGCLHHCLLDLRDRADTDQWLLLGKRMGVPLFGKDQLTVNPYWWKHRSHDKLSNTLWTPGGAYDRRNGFTRILLLHEHLERPQCGLAVPAALSIPDLHLLESEVANHVNPDRDLHPTVITEATQYIRRRIPSLLGYRRPNTSYRVVSWFFQASVPTSAGRMMNWKERYNFHNERNELEWLPPKKS